MYTPSGSIYQGYYYVKKKSVRSLPRMTLAHAELACQKKEIMRGKKKKAKKKATLIHTCSISGLPLINC